MAECLLWDEEEFGSNPTVAIFILFYFLILLFYLEGKTTSRRAGLTAIAEFLYSYSSILNNLTLVLEILVICICVAFNPLAESIH